MATTEYIWNVANDTVLMEKDGSGTTKAVYHTDPVQYGRLFSMRRDGKTSNYRYDAQGNTRALTDETGKTTDTYNYSAFGTPRTQSGTTENPYRYGGQWGYQYNAATGDYYIRARTYQPAMSRWLSKDPLRFSDGTNWYVYVTNVATLLIDQAGLFGMQDHVNITETLVREWAARQLVPDACRDYVQRMVVCSNLSQDFGPNYDKPEVHYTRPYRRGDEAVDSPRAAVAAAARAARIRHGVQWDTRYSNYVTAEMQLTNAAGSESCGDVLRAIGRLSHTFQDFYGHAVERRIGPPWPGTAVLSAWRVDAGFVGRFRRRGSENSWYPGFAAFTRGVTGTPYSRQDFIPASYEDFWRPRSSGEHPRMSEPLIHQGAEWGRRDGAARAFMTDQVFPMLDLWYIFCGNCCPDLDETPPTLSWTARARAVIGGGYPPAYCPQQGIREGLQNAAANRIRPIIQRVEPIVRPIIQRVRPWIQRVRPWIQRARPWNRSLW